MLDRLSRSFLVWYRPHQAAYLTALAAMVIVDFFWLDGWATFWPMAVWSTLFGFHFMVVRSLTVDETWAQDRALLETYRPWDTGHIEVIKNRPFGKSIYRTELGRIDSKDKASGSRGGDKRRDGRQS